ncbi:MAG: hypothetical protein ACLFWI_06400 [Coleofasciculus sp.]|uniref:hypothetical protein n=1 Tax=Coleofasciculus sp. TaxID=3100458 RepID=UPI003A337D93
MTQKPSLDLTLLPLTPAPLVLYRGVPVKPQPPRLSWLKVTGGTVGLLLMLTLPALACGGLNRGWLFGSSLITLPAMSLMYGYGLPLLATVLIESFILCKRELIPFRKAFVIAGLANGFYLLASLVSWVSLSVMFPLALIGSILSAAMCLSFCQRRGYLKNISQGMFRFCVYLFFMALGFATLFLISAMDSSENLDFLYAVTAGLLLIGFILGFVTKGFAIAGLLKQKHPNLAMTVMSMQVGSFGIIPMAYYLMQLQA